MKQRLFSVILLAALMWSAVQAASVSETRARAIAAEFMTQKHLGNIATSSAAKVQRRVAHATQGDAAYYVFNGQNSGFVVVSGDDRTLAVLGYSDGNRRRHATPCEHRRRGEAAAAVEMGPKCAFQFGMSGDWRKVLRYRMHGNRHGSNHVLPPLARREHRHSRLH